MKIDRSRSRLDGSTDRIPLTLERVQIAESLRGILVRAIDILKSFGCTEIYVFGSLAHGTADADSDVDLAVRGCPKTRFFRAMGTLMKELDREVDLVDLDCEDPFAGYLQKRGELVQVA
ncbi:MAG: nucleotidyltransferase domain-containing protein [bacterium]|nr:nucleotidyltransferase domain-containing protein [bacterium]